MRKIKEVLRLHALGLSRRQIALSCAVGQATVSDYLKAATAGLKWAEVADWDDDRLWKAAAPSRCAKVGRAAGHCPPPDGADPSGSDHAIDRPPLEVSSATSAASARLALTAAAMEKGRSCRRRR